jgi:D-glycero-D-manno-heptose 1,7-bisphosphate phosphatase
MIFSSERVGVGGPAIFIDRDGVINRRRPDDYVLEWSQFRFVPGIRSALRQIASLGLPIIIISNQAAVGRGLLDPVALEKITAQLHEVLLTDEVTLSAAYYCPHRSDANCPCRKPKPELFFHAARDFSIDLSRSIFIGDSDTDVQAALAAGCKPVLFGPGLVASADKSEWPPGLPVAQCPEDLFNVAAKCLQATR